MKLPRDIAVQHDGKFLHMYDLIYQDGSRYEVASRKPVKNITDFVMAEYAPADAVTILAFDDDYDHVLLCHEWRAPVNDFLVEFPAGLVELGESPEQAATRELWEETGCKLTKIIEVLPPAYHSAGMSNEKVSLVICEAEGTPSNRHQEAGEDITPGWYTREGVKWLFDHGYKFSARAQMFLWCWINV